MKLALTLLGVLIGAGIIFLGFSLFFGDVESVQVMTSAVVSAFTPLSVHDFDIPDECGIMFGRLLHNVKNEETCSQKCRVKCISEDYAYENSDFELSANGCNQCSCHCKG